MPLEVVFIVLILIVFRLLHAAGRLEDAGFGRRCLFTAAAAWAAEESCIRIYGFYAYTSRWDLFIGHVPLIVVVIWPLLLHSAWWLALQILGPRSRGVAPLAAAIVWTDALLIEPAAVQSGLWNWHGPGLFSVPLIGIFGWFFFALGCLSVYEVQRCRGSALFGHLTMLWLPPAATHLLLLAAWWSVLRWLSRPIDPGLAAAAAWLAALLLAVVAYRRRIGALVHKQTLWLRLPAAVFFFFLVGLEAARAPWLAAYAAAFALPYLILMVHQYTLRLPGADVSGSG